MQRRLALALILMVAAQALQAATKSDTPNILVLYADDLGYGDLSCQNATSKIQTPNLDRLAMEGMRFTDGHSSSGVCTPSRYALLTGRYHWRKFHGIVGPLGPSVFSAERLTLPEMLQEKGYHTAAIGKWHLGWDWDSYRLDDAEPVKVWTRPDGVKVLEWGADAFDWTQPIPDGPLAHGFDHYFGDTVINFPPYCWINDDRVVDPPDTRMDTSKWKPIKEGYWECRAGPMVSGWDPYQNIPVTLERGKVFIREQSRNEQPFFLYFAFPSPHAPIIPNDEFDGKSGAGPYGDFVVETDDACGQLLRVLEESGQADNTIVIFSADNGPEKYAYPRDEKFGHWSAEPFRGLKQDLYEGGHHVPFVIRWPGVTRLGSVSHALVSQIDLMATIASIVHYTLPEGQAEDSINLMPLLKGGDQAVRESLVHNTWKGTGYAVRVGQWLLVDRETGYVRPPAEGWEQRHGYPAEDNLPHELYNLSEDPGQRHNLAETYPERVETMKKKLKQIRRGGSKEIAGK